MTRFFIPLIDVLILLFCIFLLMPLFKASAESPAEDRTGDGEGKTERAAPDTARERNDTADRLREELERLRQEKGQSLQQRLAVRVLEIDARTGKLFFNDPERTEISNEAEAQALLQRDRRAIGESRRELYYEILYPRSGQSLSPPRAAHEIRGVVQGRRPRLGHPGRLPERR